MLGLGSGLPGDLVQNVCGSLPEKGAGAALPGAGGATTDTAEPFGPLCVFPGSLDADRSPTGWDRGPAGLQGPWVLGHSLWELAGRREELGCQCQGCWSGDTSPAVGGVCLHVQDWGGDGAGAENSGLPWPSRLETGRDVGQPEMSRELRGGAWRAEARLSCPLREQLQASLREEARTPNLGDCWGPSFPPTGPQGALLAGQPGEWGRERPVPGRWRGAQACGAALAEGPPLLAHPCVGSCLDSPWWEIQPFLVNPWRGFLLLSKMGT